MILTYCYRIKPNAEKVAVMLDTLELLGRHWNYSLGQRLDYLRLILHRPIPDGFTLKTCTIVHKPDGWYACISMEDATVPELLPLVKVKSAIGVDVGLKDFLTTSDGETIPIQPTYRQTQGHLARQQRRLTRKQKGSKRHEKQKNKIARIHQRISRKRKDFHYNTAHKLVKEFDLIAVEDLNIKGLARTRLSKSILDAAWGKFITILEAVAIIRGVRVVKVNPHGTTIDCSSCGAKVPKTLSMRLHECHKCGCSLDRDVNAALNILERALSEVGLILPARGGLVDTQPTKRELLGYEGTQLPLF